MRGDDHLNNTFRQKTIYDAMGWNAPEFAHLPLIHGADGAKFSKRHGAQSVQEFREMGYLPEALSNYLLRLGWSHGDDEIISRDDSIKWFNFENIGKAAAKFDFAKLESLNAHYINECEPTRLIELATPFYEQRHGITPSEKGKERLIEGIEELKSRAKTLLQFVDESAFYVKEEPLTFNDKAQKTIDESKEILAELEKAFSAEESLTSENVQSICKEIADKLTNGKLGKAAMPLRAAITGTTVSPSVFHAAAILGKEETCLRIQYAQNKTL